MVGDYISREAAIAETRKPRLTDAELRRRLASIPAADVVKVVRCGDCIRKDICRTSNVWAVSPDDNWFCADGERKDGGQEPPKEEQP